VGHKRAIRVNLWVICLLLNFQIFFHGNRSAEKIQKDRDDQFSPENFKKIIINLFDDVCRVFIKKIIKIGLDKNH
jgi:hypothetical protein